eukprot:9488673-Pyramimonas_sp.AAC.1
MDHVLKKKGGGHIEDHESYSPVGGEGHREPDGDDEGPQAHAGDLHGTDQARQDEHGGGIHRKGGILLLAEEP